MSGLRTSTVVPYLVLAALLLGAPAAHCAEKLLNEDCLSCHTEVDEAAFKASVHGGEDCVSCHSDVKSLEHPEKLAPVDCASCHESEAMAIAGSVHGKLKDSGKAEVSCADCHGSHDVMPPAAQSSKMHRFNVAKTCASCHERIGEQYLRSVHGKAMQAGKFEAPVCTDCHGEHGIRSHLDPKARVHATQLSEKVCAQCHAAERITSKFGLSADRIKTYFDSYHGLAGRAGSVSVANCASCHGAHDILPSKDPASSVHKKNLVKTCGECHPGASERLTEGTIHLAPSPDQDRKIYYLTIFYVAFIFLVVGSMLAHNLLDLRRKVKEHYEQRHARSHQVRFNANERLQHLILAMTFTLLAYTGFALKFPEAWWAWPIVGMDPTHAWRGRLHRWAAIVFTVLCVYHVGYILLTPRGRGQLRSMLPRHRDLKDAIQMVRHNLGHAVRRPRLARYTYVEKLEYWALAWGTVIMVVTGAVLVFENISLKYLPKWLIDAATVVHYYEAILATLAILIWHLYFTVFDPEHYPMNWSMKHGRTHEEREDDEHPAAPGPPPQH